MLRLIIEKELKDLIGSTKFIVTFGAFFLLIVTAFYVGATRYNLNYSYYRASKAEILRSMEGLTDWNDLDQTRIFLPPSALASLVSGVSNDIGRTAIIRGRGDIPVEDSRYNEDPIFAIFRFLDLEFIFKVLLSLFAILMGYDAISGEKERGTLRLSLANAVPRQTYIFGKLIGSLIVLVVSVIVASAVGTLILPMMGIDLVGDEWIKFMLIIFAGLLYGGIFLTLSIFVSSLTQRSANSFLVLLVVWVFCIHIVPRVSVIMAARSVDVPSVDEIAYKKSGLSKQLFNEFDEGFRSFSPSGIGSNPEEFEKQINSFIDSLNDIRDTKMQSFASRLNEDRTNKQKIQEKLAFALARISPATSLTLATSYLAGTSIEMKNNFTSEAHDYQESFANFMKEKTGMNTGGMLKIRTSSACTGGGDDEETAAKPKKIDPKEVPDFKYIEKDSKESIQMAAADFGILFLFNIFFVAGAFFAFNKYDVR